MRNRLQSNEFGATRIDHGPRAAVCGPRVSRVRRWKLLGWLLALWLGSGLFLGSLFSLRDEASTLDYTTFLLEHMGTHVEDADSWGPMWEALHYVHGNGEKSLYQHLFFDKQMKFQYPPTSLLVLEPFFGGTLLNLLLWANLVSWLSLVAMVVLCAWIMCAALRDRDLQDAWPIGRWYVAATVSSLFLVTFYPIVRGYATGQIQIWINALFAGAVLAWVLRRHAVAGVLCGLICVIKPQLGLLVIWALLRKRWRFMWAMLLTVGCVGLVSVWRYGLANHLDYLRVLSFIARHGESFHPNHSVNGLLNRLLFNGNNIYWDSHNFAPYNVWVHMGTLISSLALIVAAFVWPSLRRRGGDAVDFSIASLSITLASPVTWEHHYGVLLPLYALAFPLALCTRPVWRYLVLLAGSYLLCCNLYACTIRLAHSRLNILQSYMLFGAVLLLITLYRLAREPTTVFRDQVRVLPTRPESSPVRD